MKEQKVLFENKTKYTEDLYNIFLKEYKKEYASSENLFTGFNFFFFGICMFFAFKENELILAFAILIGLIIYFWYKFIRPATREIKTRKNPMLKDNFINTYKFYERYFDVENPKGKARTYYLKVYRITETQDYYYIYISREYAFIVSKTEFTEGNNIEFTTFIKKKLLGKYRNRMKNKE